MFMCVFVFFMSSMLFVTMSRTKYTPTSALCRLLSLNLVPKDCCLLLAAPVELVCTLPHNAGP